MPVPDLDQWSYLDVRIGTLDTPDRSWVAPGWLPQSAFRRMAAYRYLASLVGNSSRHYRDDDKLREYGDPALFVNRTASGLLGDTLTLTVDGAAHEPSPLPPAPPEVPDDLDDVSRTAVEAVNAGVHEQAVAEWEESWALYREGVDTQQWLRGWAETVQFDAKIHELMHQAVVPLGDGVVVVDRDDGPTLTIFPPDAYHPVLDDLDDGKFPETVHLAWGFERDGKEWVRRITYRLEAVEPWRPKYASPDDPPATTMCFKSDGVWPVDAAAENKVDDLADTNATWTLNTDGQEIRDLPLQVHHIPVVHFPNGFSTLTHFGTSSLAAGVQVLEQVAQNDTDLASAAEIAGTPMVFIAGLQGELGITVSAGSAVGGGDGATVMDLSGSVRALLEYEQRLCEREERVLNVPAGIVGRDNGQAQSGVSRKIANFAYDQLVANLRLVVAPKLALLLKFVQRAELAGANPRIGRVVPARVQFGAYLPSDMSDTVAEVVELLKARAVSPETGLRMLQEAGLEIADLGDELQRILAADTRGAVEVADATGSEQAAADRLGIELETVEPTISLGDG